MNEMIESDREITRYLLGESSAEDQKHIEERYFSDPNSLEQVLGVEDDLIDAYVRQELGAHERERFENYFLASPERRQRVDIADALRMSLREPSGSIAAPIAQTRSSRQSLSALLRGEGLAVRFAFAAALLVAVVGGLWLFLENRRLRAQLDQVQLEKSRAQPQEQQLAARGNENKQLAQQEPEKSTGDTSTQKSAVSTSSTVGPAIASFVLTPGLTRDVEGTNKLVILRNTQSVRLLLKIESKREYKSYHGSLQRIGAGEIWSHTFHNSAATGKESLTIKLPVILFARGEYLLTLTGFTAANESDIVGDYPFTVVKQQ